MDEAELKEFHQFKSLFLKLMGKSDGDPTLLFKREALDNAAKQFQKMEVERGEWVEEFNLSDYFKDASYQAGKFLREEFVFTAWIKNGHHYLYNKAALKELAKELKERKLNLARYIEYKRSEEEFQQKIATMKGKGLPAYLLPDEARNVDTSPIPQPDLELVKKDLEFLKAEFTYYNIGEYVDIYRGNHAMLKTIYHFQKYIDKALKKRCIKWCDDFNYANRAFTMITDKKDKFVPSNDDMIEL